MMYKSLSRDDSGFFYGENMVRLIAIVMLSLVLSDVSMAADNDGKFAAKGAARRVCSDFTQASKDKTSDVLLYGGWVEGYLSAYNQFQPDTYDVMPWQTTELVLIFLRRHCESHPQTKFFDAMSSLISSLFPIRLEQESAIVSVDVNNGQSYYYVEILKRAKQRLHAMGHYATEPVYDDFNEQDIKAFADFQTKLGLQATGIPDQLTLSSLFLKSNPKQE